MKISRLLKVLVILTFLISISNISMAQSLGDRARKFQQEIKEKQRIENTNYNETCRIGTINAYRDYLKKYEKENYVPQEHITDIKNRIVDYDVWSRAKAKHTISAYESYIKESKYKSYLTEANEAITDIKSVDEWNRIKNNTDISNINKFLANFPKSSRKTEAQSRIYELTAVNYYKLGDLVNAHRYFKKIDRTYSIAYENRILNQKSEEYYEYDNIRDSSSEITLLAYLDKYPNSDYFNEVSNIVAVYKAKEFKYNTPQSSFNSALKYAKNDNTRREVQKYIKSAKDRKAQINRFQNGGTILFGLEPIDFGLNLASSQEGNFKYYYNVGLSVKIGNYKDPLQFEIGVKPGAIIIEDSNNYDYYDDSNDNEDIKFHMPAYARLKVNLISLLDDSNIYISGLGFYNAIRDKNYENEFSVGGGIGMAWRHWDWQILYYKQDLEATNGRKNQMIGTSLIYYF